jgi:deoxycytidylate deaminase
MVCDRFVREGGTIYVTGHVCHACAKLIANSGLAAVVVALAADERDRAYRDPDKSYALLEQCGVEVVVETK